MPLGSPAAAAAAPANPKAAAPWKCPKCGEMVPGTFEVCWKCLSDQAGQQPANAQQLLSEVDDEGQGVVTPLEASEIVEPETDDEAPKPETVA